MNCISGQRVHHKHFQVFGLDTSVLRAMKNTMRTIAFRADTRRMTR